MLEKYRPSMDSDVLHSWAKDAQEKLDQQAKVIEELRTHLALAYPNSYESIAYLNKLAKRDCS